MAKNEATIHTPEQLRKTEEFAQILKKSSAKGNREIIVTLGSAFISGLEAGLQLSGQKEGVGK